ncbi:hypothetical protein ACFQAV_09210 [Companilactobacillus huachuanensis]|uniref:Uncharacterized protein n=1 Tax=Companilactobacillus huachuanensis TaxID=2559914 RepID=A0ABW1RPN3_9LACO|nr:hypothetical protein [Companilactobacillus huachuanensis]
MSYLHKHSFFLIVVFVIGIYGNRYYFLDLNMFSQWALSIILTILDLLVFIPLMWFWTEKRLEAKQYKSARYSSILRAYPYRLSLQYFVIISTNLAANRLTHYPLTVILLISLIVLIILTPVYLDYFTNADLFHFSKFAA